MNALIADKDIVYCDDFIMTQLKRKIVDSIGYVLLTKSDCSRLSETISKKGFGNISESTLYRLFFQSGKHKPYKHTIDILSNFLGYDSFNQFIEETNHLRDKFLTGGISNNIESSLLFNCIETSSYKALASYFDNIEGETILFKEQLGLHLFDCLMHSTKSAEFFKYFSSHQYVRSFFYENVHDPKFRINHYNAGYAFYLQTVTNYKTDNHFQDFVFGNCVLFRHYFINGLLKEAVQIGDVLYKENTSVNELNNRLHVFPYCRYISYKLWYLKLIVDDTSIMEEHAHFILDLCCSLKNNLGDFDKKIFFHTIAEAFIYSSIDVFYHDRLRELFKEEISSISPALLHKNLSFILRYFEPNGLLYYRP